MDTLEFDALRVEVAASRARQGLPPTIEDPDTVARVAPLLADALATTEMVTSNPTKDGENDP